jgi:ribonuclease R
MSASFEQQMREGVRKILNEPGRRPLRVRELMRALGIPRDDRRAFRRALRDLLSEREVVRVGRDRYAASRADQSDRESDAEESGGRPGRDARGGGRTAAADRTVRGRLQRHPRGFGFVTPEGGGRDVLIPQRWLGDWMDGDRVEVLIRRRGHDGRAVGEVVRALERSKKRVMGVYRAQGGPRGPGYVEAYDRLFEAGILIPEGETGGATNGMVVGVAISRPPSREQRALGRIVEVLGHPDEPGIDLKTIVRKYDLRSEFSPDVLAAAEGIPDHVPEAESGRREDFRALPIVTIDGETAMDFDDAVFVRKHADGSYELQVHIADVAHYVRAATAIDQEAYERGTSVYFPGTAIPMLPHKLSNGICSLNPGVDRLVQSCLMTIDPEGEVIEHRFAQGVMRSAARMTYTEVARILVDRDPGVCERYRDLVPIFQLMEELSEVLNRRRRARGSIDFDLPEPEIILAATGEMTGIMALERNVAHRLIEEFMLIANETVARHLWNAHVPSMFRIHERPDPSKLEDFDRVAQAFGYRLPRPFTSIEPAMFQSLLEAAQGTPEERFLSRLMLRSMKQARYSEGRDIHFGLASSCYTHFTSPIRRYPDLIVHRILKRILKGQVLTEKERAVLEEFLPEAALQTSRTERNADAAENELIEWKKIAFMGERLGEEFDGFIISLHPYGFFVELNELFIDGLVQVESLGDDDYRFVERKQILEGERHGRVYKLGDKVRVRVDRVNPFLLQIDFSLVEPDDGSESRPRGRRRAAPRVVESRRRAGRRRQGNGPQRREGRGRGRKPRGSRRGRR